jgi:ATP-dependent Clp protease ATP-binding subunit ClpC
MSGSNRAGQFYRCGVGNLYGPAATTTDCHATSTYCRKVFERFTIPSRRVLVLAQEEARLLNHSSIGTEHLFLGLMREGGGPAVQVLTSLGISFEGVRGKVEETFSMMGPPPEGSPGFTPRAKQVLEFSLREALQLNQSFIGTEHLLLGLVRESEGVGANILVSLGADLATVRQQVIKLISAGHNLDDA